MLLASFPFSRSFYRSFPFSLLYSLGALPSFLPSPDVPSYQPIFVPFFILPSLPSFLSSSTLRPFPSFPLVASSSPIIYSLEQERYLSFSFVFLFFGEKDVGERGSVAGDKLWAKELFVKRI